MTSPRLTASIAAALLTLGALLIAPATTPPAQATPPTDIVDSPVGLTQATALGADGTTYAVGLFAGAGAATGGLANLAADDSTLNRSFPPVVGTVKTIVPDASGGFYLGGQFTRVGALSRVNIAHVLADGTVDTAWAPSLATSGTVSAMSLVGNTLYIGGNFTTVNGTNRQNIAAVNATTGALTSWNPGANFAVSALTADDSALYAGGSFTSIASTPRNRLAAFDITTGDLVSAWDPNCAGTVNSLVSTGSLVYIGGSFTTIASTTRNRLAAVNAVATGNANLAAWNPGANNTVNALAFDDSSIYAVGQFTAAGSPSQTRNYAAAFDRGTGALSASWNPALSSWGLSVAVASDAVYAGGYFTTVNGSASRSMLAKLDKTTGNALAWDAGLFRSGGEGVEAIALSASRAAVVAGGNFTHAKAVSRSNAAAFDSNGRVTNWAPSTNSNILGIAIRGTTAYVVGGFTTVNSSTPRNRAAAFRIDDTGTVTNWNPNFNGAVQDMEVLGSRAYVVGAFTTVGSPSQTRNRAAAVELDDTGTLTTWDPNLNQSAFGIALSGSLAYIGGLHTQVNGSITRNRAAAFRTDDTGTVTSWNPNVNSAVRDIQIGNGLAYLAGEFSQVNGSVTRNLFAAVGLDDTAAATSWNPNGVCNTAVSSRCMSEIPGGYSIALSGPVAYLGGKFTTIAGTDGIIGLGAVRTDDSGSLVTSWTPTMSFLSSTLPYAYRIVPASGSLGIAGSFGGISLDGVAYSSNTAVVPAAATAPDAPTGVAATAGNASASVAWTVASTGGSPITRVEFALDDTATVDDSTTNTSSPYTISGLSNGQAYVVYIRLVNAIGTGAWSAASATFTPQAPPAPPAPALPPGAPSAVAATPGNAEATVKWSPPADTGTFPIVGYVVRAQPGAQTCSTATTTCTVTGLTNGTAYTFTVTASSTAGNGPASAASGPVTPRTIPQAPTAVSAEAGDAQATITWSPPTDDGGSPITGYRVTTIPTSQGCTVTTTTCTLTGLTNGTEYVVSVVATNAAGSTAPATTTVTPRGKASIVITGTRSRNDPAVVKILGTVTNLDVTTVQPYVRLGRQTTFQPAVTQATVGDEGRFRWQRLTNRRITVYVEAGGFTSNRVTVPER